MATPARLVRAQLGKLDLIGRGGQGRVYRAPDLTLPDVPGALVYKDYRRNVPAISGLEGMTLFRQRLPPYERGVLDVLSNWPVRVVEAADGGADGVVIPLIPDAFFHDIRRPDGSTKRLPRDGQYLVQPPERRNLLGLPDVGIGDRYRFCRDLALAVGFLHKRDVCLGDISFGNATYALDLDPSVYLVDCDAFRIKGSAPVVPQLHTPDWVPPEGARVQSVRTDLYKLGLYVLRALAPKPLSAQNRDPSWADDVLTSEGRALLRRALSADPDEERTPARDWFAYFDGTLRRKRLKTTRHVSRMPPKPAGAGAAP